MRPCEKYHSELERRFRPALRLRKYLRQVGLNVPREWRPLAPCETYAVHTIQHLLERYGEGTVTLAIRLVIESNADNAREVKAEVITAMCAVLNRHPDWTNLGLSLFDCMDRVDISSLRVRAKRLAQRNVKPSAALAGMIALRLGDLIDAC